MAAQQKADGAAQPDSGTASSALGLGELDITSTEVSLKGASGFARQVPGGVHIHRRREPALTHAQLRLCTQAWRASWSSMPSTRSCEQSWIRAATPGSTGGSMRHGCGKRSWSPSRTTWLSQTTWCYCTSRRALEVPWSAGGGAAFCKPPWCSHLLRACPQISSCDGILGTMEEMLGKFQSDLGNISLEIRALQEQSQSMSVRLRNRKAAELQLGSFLDSLALPAPLIDGILQPQSDVAFQA